MSKPLENTRPECLGMNARDIVTGFSGIVTSYCQYLTGCTQVSITPMCAANDGKLPDTQWFDIQRVELVDRGIADTIGHSNTGGPQITPPTSGRHV